MYGKAVVLVSYPSRDSMHFWSVPVVSFSSLFLSDYSVLAFASFSRGQPPARRTKVVDDNLCPLKSGSTCLCVPVCAHDAMPTTLGRDAADLNTHTTCGCVVSDCGSLRCKTCKQISQGSTDVVSHNISMDCTSDNVVYLITCKKCGIQYVGETSQK